MVKGVRTFFFGILVVTGLSSLAQPVDTMSCAQRYDVFFLDAMIQRQKGNDAAAFDLLQRCVDIRPDASEAHFFLAQYYVKMKDQQRALEHFQKAAELNPENSIYAETLAQLYINQNLFSEATRVVSSLYEKHKDRDDLLELLYRLYYQQQDYDNAILTLERMEAVDGKSERLSYAKSELFTLKNDRSAALKEIKSLADQYPNDLNYRDLYGDMLLMNEREQEALEVFANVLSEEPDNVHALMSMRAYHKGKSDSIAADSLTRRLLFGEKVPTEQRIHVLRQEIMESQNGCNDSTYILNLFRRMLATNPVDVDIASLCVAYMDLKKMPRDSMVAVLEKILLSAPDHAPARLQLVSYAWEEENMDRVIALCSDARQYNADEMAFYYYQGMAYYRKKDNDHALDAFRNGISVINDDSDPAIASDFYAVLGDLLHQKGLVQEAFAAYDSCLQKKEDNIGCLNNYAYYLSELGQQLDKAEQMSYRTIKAEPKNATYLDTYAWILFMQQRYSEAKIYIDQAVQNDEEHSGVLIEHAGDIYAMGGDLETALKLWREAYEIAPDNKLLAKKINQRKYIKKK